MRLLLAVSTNFTDNPRIYAKYLQQFSYSSLQANAINENEHIKKDPKCSFEFIKCKLHFDGMGSNFNVEKWPKLHLDRVVVKI